MSDVELWTDGACSGNPGPGGWACLLRSGSHERELSGHDPATTNNRMELMAVIEGLAALNKSCRVTVHIDSTYVMHAITKRWIGGWQKRGWKTSDKKPVKNQDLWQVMLELTKPHQITWKWVKGHAMDELNNRCDELAVEARLKIKREGI